MAATLIRVTPLLTVDTAALVSLVGRRPAGAKLDIAGLARALAPSQANVISAIQALIAEGAIDARTLRPIAPAHQRKGTLPIRVGMAGSALFDLMLAEGRSRGLNASEVGIQAFGNKARLYGLKSTARLRQATIDRARTWLGTGTDPAAQDAGAGDIGIRQSPPAVTGAELAAEIEAEGARRGMKPSAVSVAVFGSNSALFRMRGSRSPVRRKSIARVRAWIAGAAASPSIDAIESAGAEARPATCPQQVTGADLAAELDAFIARAGVTPGRVSRLLFDSGTGLDKLRQASRPKAETVEKVRLFIASPPHELTEPGRRRFKGAQRPLPAPRRDPTSKPETPLADLAERQRLNGQRHQANIRRGQEKDATARLDEGKPARNSFERSLMANIERRRESEARQADPFEAAKLKLQRTRVVHSAAVSGGRADRFIVSGCEREVTRAEIIQLAAGELTVGQINDSQRRAGQ